MFTDEEDTIDEDYSDGVPIRIGSEVRRKAIEENVRTVRNRRTK